MQESRAARVVDRNLDDVDAWAKTARGAVVDVQIPVCGVGYQRRGVRAAPPHRHRCYGQADRADKLGVGPITDVEYVKALESQRNRLAVAGCCRWSRRVPGADEDRVPDQDIALVACAVAIVEQLNWVVRLGDVNEPEAVVVAVDRELPPE